jgi:hypothetical protein
MSHKSSGDRFLLLMHHEPLPRSKPTDASTGENLAGKKEIRTVDSIWGYLKKEIRHAFVVEIDRKDRREPLCAWAADVKTCGKEKSQPNHPSKKVFAIEKNKWVRSSCHTGFVVHFPKQRSLNWQT